MVRMTLTLMTALVALVAAAGCSPDDADDGPQEATATFVAVDIDYSESPESVPAGDVTLELVNEGQLEHNVVIEELGEQPVVEAGPGETATGTATLEPGEYVIYCSEPGHRESGMETTLSVQG